MTLIELVAALALFVVILGSLLTILNTATSLWSSSRSQQREQNAGQNILELLADDLQQAVTDSGAPSNAVASTYPCFILDSRTNQPAAGGVQIVLQFARHAKPQALINASSGTPTSLDAVFYTFSDNALFRHAIPLTFDPAADKPLGQLLDDQRVKVNNRALHEQIRASMKDPAQQPAADWHYTLLAERIDLLNLPAALPEAYARKTKSTRLPPPSLAANVLPPPPEYDYLETDVLPDRIDVTLRLHSEESWAALQRLGDNASDEADRQRQLLGFRFAKRITFPAQGGSRLP